MMVKGSGVKGSGVRGSVVKGSGVSTGQQGLSHSVIVTHTIMAMAWGTATCPKIHFLHSCGWKIVYQNINKAWLGLCGL